ncbi:MAG TPA: 2-succinyl-5-enolpyruvyl-6-hydroxy-3-cyclohexene-1-carboxylic-acid synthase [Acidimicrobiales bacterium]
MSVQATFTATLVDEWARLGVRDAVVCPGSRSTPLALPLAQRLRAHVRLDERSAAFYAVGLARANGRPVVVCVTSGTAAAELHPAVVEAHHARVPLIVCTADRPPELHHTGASQTIEQDALFAGEARWRTDPGVPAAGAEATWRPLAARAFAESMHGPNGPGPVHLNLAFREPLTDAPDTLPAPGGPAVAPPAERPPAAPASDDRLEGRGIVVVGGPSYGRADAHAVGVFASRLGWPVLADPLSRCRVEGTIAAADAIVRTRPDLPEVVVQLGAPWLSKALGDYVTQAAAAGARIVVVDPWRQRPDPLRVATEFVHQDVHAWLAAMTERAGDEGAADPGWLSSWRGMEARAQEAIDGVLGAELSEPQVARALYRHAAAVDAAVVVSASMPIRDLEWYAPALPAPPNVMANRGANGIDGVVSTALGVAASGAARQTLALLGDLAFLHDVSGLVNVPEVPCTFVVVDNDGGGIFSFLPQATTLRPDVFEPLFGTPPTTDLGAVARGFGLPVEEVTKLSDLEPALAAAPAVPALVRVRVPTRAQNVAVHDAINQAVRLALGP